MRPEKERNIIQRGIDMWLAGNKQFLRKNIKVLCSYRDRMEKEELRVSSECGIELLEGEISPSGHSTYGYKDEESISNNMYYISDRWCCAWRLQWIIDGIRCGAI